jgi:hypothetical protein
VDGNLNGQYDQEAYHPSLTGYIASPVPGNLLPPEGDLGRAITLHPGSTFSPPSPGQYLAIALPPINQGMLELIAQDPNAEWDDATRSVINSDFALAGESCSFRCTTRAAPSPTPSPSRRSRPSSWNA